MTPNETNEMLADFAKEHQQFKQKAQLLIENLDAEIESKQKEYDQLLLSVNVDDAVSLILADCDRTTGSALEKTRKVVSMAGVLSTHVPVERIGGYNGNGEPFYSVVEPKPIGLLHGLSAIDLVAMLPNLFRPAIEAWARSVLIENGCSEKGAHVPDLHQRAGGLIGEIKALNEQRSQAASTLRNLIDEELTLHPEYLAFTLRSQEVAPAALASPAIRFPGENGQHV